MTDPVRMSPTHASYASRWEVAERRNDRLREGLHELFQYLRAPWWRRLRRCDADPIRFVDALLDEVRDVVRADLSLAADPENEARQRELRDALDYLTAGYVR